MGTEQFILETISLFFHCIVGSKKKPRRALKTAGNFLGRLSVHSESFLFYMITIKQLFYYTLHHYIKQVFFPLASWNILLSFFFMSYLRSQALSPLPTEKSKVCQIQGRWILLYLLVEERQGRLQKSLWYWRYSHL